MRLKFLFIVGLGVGYVLGARAGRPRYEQLKAKATDAWEDPRVQKVVSDTQEFVKENAPIIQNKVVSGTKAAVSGVQDAAARASDVAKDLSGKAAETSKAVSGKVTDTTREVSDKVAKTTKEVSSKVAKTTKDASTKAKDASKKTRGASKRVAKAAHEASDSVSQKAKKVRNRIVDRGEEVVDGVIIAAGTAREEALEVESDEVGS